MLITAHKAIDIDTKEPKEALAQIIQFIRLNSERLAAIKVRFILYSSKPDALLYLTQFVPDDESCFQINYKNYKKIELEKQLETGATTYTFDCELTKFLSGDKALSFIERDVFEMKPGILRGLSFMLRIEGIKLKGLPTDGTAVLQLMDLKGWQRKQRFNCVISLSFRGAAIKDKETKAILKTVTTQTGLDFIKSKIMESTPADVATQIDTEQLLVIHTCFNEAVVETSQDMEKVIPDWTLVPRLKRRFDSAVRDRLEDINAGKTSKVNFNSIAKKFFKAELADFVFDTNDGEVLWFSKSASKEVEILVGIEKIHLSGLGKTFTLKIDIRVRTSEDATPIFLNTNFGKPLHESDELCWTYATEDGLMQALHVSSGVLKKILISWDERVQKYFSSVSRNIPEELTRRIGFTMKDVYEEAHKIAMKFSSDSELVGAYSGCNLQIRELGGGTGVNEQGKLKPHGYWGFYYKSEIRDLRFFVTVPAIGSNSYTVHGRIKDYRPPVIMNLPNLLDSDKAMDIAQKQLNELKKQETSLSIWDAQMQLDVSGPHERWFVERKSKYDSDEPIWSVQFLGSSERGRTDLSVAFAAKTGETIISSID